jgi:hypothetical protein
MANFPVFPDLRDMIDWCNQPAPQFAGDTHALFFFMRVTDFAPLLSKGLLYQGFLFFRPPPVGSSPRRNAGHFEGTGRLVPTRELRAFDEEGLTAKAPSWVRIQMGCAPASIVGVVSFFNGTRNLVETGPENMASLPVNLASQFESDLQIGQQPTPPSDAISIILGPAQFEVHKTSLIL